MALFDNLFGGTKSVPTTSTTQLPAWVEKGGQELFGAGKTFAGRDYPAYPVGERIAPFSSDQLASFEATRSNVGSYAPAFQAAMGGVGAAATPVGESDIARYMNPYTEQVIDTTLAELGRQGTRDRISRHGGMAMEGSFLNEDRRMAMDTLANESLNRIIAETSARLRSDAFNNALQQANVERGRTMEAAGMFGTLAPMRQQLGAADAAALASSGAVQQAQEQQGRTLSYDEFMQGFAYPQEQINWLMGLLTGSPYPTTTTGTTAVGTPNRFAEAIGAAAALAGMFG